MPPRQSADLTPLVGSWRLVSMKATFTDTQEHYEPFGSAPDGRMVLEPGGRVIFFFTHPPRLPPADDAGRLALFNTLMVYTGLVRSDAPGQFTTTIDLAWNPIWTGEQTRFFKIEGDHLYITSAEYSRPSQPDRRVIAEVLLQREHRQPTPEMSYRRVE